MCKALRYSGIVSTGEIAPSYSHFLCFTVTERTNALAFYQDKYTQEQEDIHALIKSLHEGGLGYRRIAHHLNANGVKTASGNNWSSPQVSTEFFALFGFVVGRCRFRVAACTVQKLQRHQWVIET